MDNDYSSGGALVAAILAFYAAFFFVFALIWIGYYVLMGFALMSFFRKVGVEPWVEDGPCIRDQKGQCEQQKRDLSALLPALNWCHEPNPKGARSSNPRGKAPTSSSSRRPPGG